MADHTLSLKVAVAAPSLTLNVAYQGPATTDTSNRAGGIDIRAKALATYDPPVASPPNTHTIVFPKVAAVPLPAPVMVNGRPTGDYANARPLYKDGARGRIIVGGKDVTFYRGVPLTVPAYSLQEPFGYGESTLVIPQHNLLFEARPKWAHDFARVEYQRVFADGTRVTDYRGEIQCVRSTGGALTLIIGGVISGSASLRNEQPPLRWVTHDVGWWAFDVARDYVHMTPRFGPRTGIRIVRPGDEMTSAAWLQQLGAMSQTGGKQRALMPKDWASNEWRFDFKDTTTVHGTIFLDGSMVSEDLADDAAEKPNTFYGTGVTPEGMRWRNSRYPEAMDAPPAPFPMRGGATFGTGTKDSDTRDGKGITVMQIKLQWAGYIEQRDYTHGTFDDATAAGVKRLQREVGLSRTGTVDTKTWKRLWNEDATGISLKASHIAPLVQDPSVPGWLFSANGSIVGANPDHVPGAREVSRNYDFGSGIRKARATDWCEEQLDKYAGKNWAGTITLNGVGAFSGKHEHGDTLTAADIIAPRDIRPGQNYWLPGFDGGTLVHVSGVQVTSAVDSSPETVQLTVDTLARDLLELSQVIARNRASRRNIRREWNRENRPHGPRHNLITFDEFGGVVDHDRRLQGGRWNRVGIVCGQTGTLERVDIWLKHRKAEFAFAIASRNISPAHMHRRAGNPMPVDATTGETWIDTAKIQDWLDDKTLLYAAGSDAMPGGYWPRRKFGDKTDSSGNPVRTSAPLTGRYRDDAGVPYRTPSDRNPLVWLLIWPDRDTVLQSGRLLYKSEDDAL